MAFRKRVARRRMRRRPMGTARRAYVMARTAVKQLYRSQEVKYIDTASWNLQSVTNAGVAVSLSNVAQGSDIVNRIGDRITVRYVNIRGAIEINSGVAAGSTQNVRIMLILDTQGTQAAGYTPGAVDLLQTNGSPLAPYSPTYLGNRGRFKIIEDRLYSVFQGGPGSHPFHIFKKIRGRFSSMQFSGTGATNIWKNGLYLFAISDSAGTNPVITMYARVAFVDG